MRGKFLAIITVFLDELSRAATVNFDTSCVHVHVHADPLKYENNMCNCDSLPLEAVLVY